MWDGKCAFLRSGERFDSAWRVSDVEQDAPAGCRPGKPKG